ncbi:MAG: DUF1552 domain-containing protein [Mariniblastus sp.]|nr:DUF1552 domain-containing protein [Mariniblastus sp.]
MNQMLSRRTVLRGMGTMVALPWLEGIASARTTARTANGFDSPVRMAFLYVPNGMHMQDWLPGGSESRNFSLPKILEPVARHRQQMNLLTGLTLDGAYSHGDGGGDHARSVASYLTGAHPRKTDGKDISNGVSVDQVAANQIGHLTRFPSLELGTEESAQAGRCDSGYSCLYTSNLSWRTRTSPLAKEVNPAAVFSRLFGGPNRAENRIAEMKRRERRQSVLDFVRQDAKKLEHQLGKADRRKLDEYLFAVREIERRIAASEKLGEVEVDVPDFPRPAGVPAEFGQHVKLLFDMMVLAFQTDSTRVISFMYTNAGSNRSYRNLGISGGHHHLSHHGGSREKQEQISQINRYHVELLGYLLDRLQSIDEGGRSLLDNSMIVYGSGIADGNSHRHTNLPIALFGEGGGSIQTGRKIDCAPGTPLTNLYCSLLDRVGAKVDTFSDSTGRIDQIGG